MRQKRQRNIRNRFGLQTGIRQIMLRDFGFSFSSRQAGLPEQDFRLSDYQIISNAHAIDTPPPPQSVARPKVSPLFFMA